MLNISEFSTIVISNIIKMVLSRLRSYFDLLRDIQRAVLWLILDTK